MTNFEYWKDKILEINKNDNIAIINDNPRKCSFFSCDDCDLFIDVKSCRQNFVEWLYSEHVKTPKLTKRERKLCEALETGWIAADKSGRVYWYSDMPNKRYDTYVGDENILNLTGAGFHFAFMDFEDEEPWMVENLLLLEVEE